MKYLTKEELEEITGKLLENPTRETLKELNNKYNGEEISMANTVTEDTPLVEIPVEAPQSYEMPMASQSVVEPIPNAVENPIVNPLPPVMDTPVATPITNYEVPTPSVSIEAPVYDASNIQEPVEMSNQQEIINPVQEQNIPVNNVSMGPEIPSFDMPQMNNPNMNNSINNEPINFTGNLWEPQNQNDLMATTDSFNQGPIEQPSVEVPVGNGQFFGPSIEPVNNPIPINNMPQMPQQGPSMFGQFEQNYNG